MVSGLYLDALAKDRCTPEATNRFLHLSFPFGEKMGELLDMDGRNR
jgi:hypothetical protein